MRLDTVGPPTADSAGRPTPTPTSSAPSAPVAAGADLGVVPFGAGSLLSRGRVNPAWFQINGGPTADATVVLTVPAGFVVADADLEGADVTCDQTGGRVTCDLGPLGAYPTSLFYYSVAPPASTPLGTVTITATVSGVEGGDPDPTNNTAAKQFQILPTSSLQTTVSPSPLTVVGTTPAPLHIALSNNGPDAATDVVVTIEARGDLALGAVTGAGTGDGDARRVTLTVASVAPGATEGIDVQVAAILPGTGAGGRAVTVTAQSDLDPGTCVLNEGCELTTPVVVAGTGPQLANTGGRDLAAGVVGLALVVTGSGLTLVGRRRRA